MPIDEMTLEETIAHYERIAKNQLKCADRIDELNCDSTSTRQMAKHHQKLAEWLRELKERRKVMDFINSNVRIIETNEGVMIRFCGGNVCEWAKNERGKR